MQTKNSAQLKRPASKTSHSTLDQTSQRAVEIEPIKRTPDKKTKHDLQFQAISLSLSLSLSLSKRTTPQVAQDSESHYVSE